MKIVTNGYVLFLFYIVSTILMEYLDAFEYLFEHIYLFSRESEFWEVDELVLSLLPLSIALALFAYGKYLKSAALNQELNHLLYTDTWSGLANRKSFDNKLENIKPATVILFKIINLQSLSTNFGLRFLENIRILACQDLNIMVKSEFSTALYQLEGNLFAIIVMNKESHIKQKILKIHKKFNDTRIGIEGKRVYLTLVSGLSDYQPLLDTAKSALEIARNHTNKTIIEYTPDIIDSQIYQHKISLLSSLKKAINNDQVILVFQPIIDNKTQKVVKHEVLMRIADENGDFISPNEFLPLAKSYKLYSFLTEAIITKSFSYFENRVDEFSINLSWHDIKNKSTLDHLFKMADKHPLCIKRLTIEMVESESYEQTKLVEFRRKIKKLGIKFALDDFGSGYSNWNILRDLAPDIIKIDGSLIQTIDTHAETKIAVQAILSIAKLYQIQTVAEYVSTAEIHATVCELGIDHSQGFFFSPPQKEPLEIIVQT